MEITTKGNKNVTLTKEIYVDGKMVKTISATINENGESISFNTDYVYDMELYKSNREAIRKIEADFEDEAFTEQDKTIENSSASSDKQGGK